MPGGVWRHAVATDECVPSPAQIVLPAEEVPVQIICCVSPDVSGDPVPTGSVTFVSNGTTIGSCDLTPDGNGNGVGSITSNFSAGSYSIETNYSGDSNYYAASPITSTTLNVVS